jgi:Xaa-Pro aminopeptidase
MNMWEHAMDYKSGTGHGIGYFLGVHEGPGKISMNLSDVPLTPGMVFSNEPGVYRNGKHGVRLENIIHVVPHVENEFGRFFRFETLTMCPLDIDAIDLDMMTSVEKDQLNAYHEKVRTLLSPKLTSEEKAWLENATRAI